ncbi:MULTISPECIES: hypothetical protein [Sporolactobacillus]|nr:MULTISPECIES: hypothetical protein [Sporolactobacillus]KLI01708.1 hypothetical protein SINU_11935 [Sporolactobacillus inulinus CASD]BBO00318.1 hypothetical protein St703_30220 [Sporolactobacillus terrae]GEB77707.1 hypothetical protein SIN01_20520 [Sporolactobacillus inulinus]
MKRIFSIVSIISMVLFGLTVSSANGEGRTRTSVTTPDGKLLLPASESHDNLPQRTGKEHAYKDAWYSFSLTLDYPHYKNQVAYKDKSAAKQTLRRAKTYLDEVTVKGHDFSAASDLQRDPSWEKFGENLAKLQNRDFGESEILNDLNNAGALFLQVQRYDDEPSLRYLYEIISDLSRKLNGGSKFYGITRTYGNKSEAIHSYLESKLD